MNRSIFKFARIVLNSKAKSGNDFLPRYFSSNDAICDELKENEPKEEKKGPDIFTMEQALKFKREVMLQNIKEEAEEEYVKVKGPRNGPQIAPLLKIGTRIRRGHDWVWKSQDGHLRLEGKIISELNKTGWVRVRWDHGGENSYRMGNNKMYDLLLATPETRKTSVKDNQGTYIEDLVTNNPFDSNLLPSLLSEYYGKIFPYDQYFKWLNYGDYSMKYFRFREFCFTMPGEIFHRYKSFQDVADLKYNMMRKCPEKIHIGAVYSNHPRMKRVTPIQALEKELTFDIDVTDYSDLRNCCSQSTICKKCWSFMVVAIKIMERALREDFGFKHIIWVFSGRRGIHCWVCDAKARALTGMERADIIQHLKQEGRFVRTNANVEKSDAKLRHIENSVKIGSKYLENIIMTHEMGSNESINKILSLLPDPELKALLRRTLHKYETSLEKWNAIYAELVKEHDKVTEEFPGRMSTLNGIILKYCYPRLDINVSVMVNHLLKSPFSIHPKTGMVCVPFSAEHADSFDPEKVPNLSQLSNEIDEYDSSHVGNNVPHYKKTSLKASIEYFEDFLSSIGDEDTVKEIKDVT